MIEFLTRLWRCVVMDDHDWRNAGIYTKQIPAGRSFKPKYTGQKINFEPHAIDFYVCDRKRCRAILWPLVWRGDKR